MPIPFQYCTFPAIFLQINQVRSKIKPKMQQPDMDVYTSGSAAKVGNELLTSSPVLWFLTFFIFHNTPAPLAPRHHFELQLLLCKWDSSLERKAWKQWPEAPQSFRKQSEESEHQEQDCWCCYLNLPWFLSPSHRRMKYLCFLVVSPYGDLSAPFKPPSKDTFSQFYMITSCLSDMGWL